MTSVTAITIFASDSTRHETSVHAQSRMVNTTTIHRVRDCVKSVQERVFGIRATGSEKCRGINCRIME